MSGSATSTHTGWFRSAGTRTTLREKAGHVSIRVAISLRISSHGS
jgi:hypothetical protein